jgi:hypothetical protein
VERIGDVRTSDASLSFVVLSSANRIAAVDYATSLPNHGRDKKKPGFAG